MIIDAKDTILGRLCSFAAKQALLGKKVDVVNCEEAYVSGQKAATFENYIRRIDRKAPNKGPYLYRRPDMFVRRTIRGMLPFKRSRGRDAFKNVMCHVGVPEKFKNENAIKFENADIKKLHSVKITKVKDICRAIGSR